MIQKLFEPVNGVPIAIGLWMIALNFGSPIVALAGSALLIYVTYRAVH